MSKKKPAPQKYQPKFIFWHELEFMGDEQVAMGMSSLQRHFLPGTLHQRNVLLHGRPYLPNDDNQLWLLADAGSLKVWQENKDAVLVKFQPVEIEGVKLLAHKRLLRDWELLLKDHKKRVKGGKNRWMKSGKKNGDHSEEDAPEDTKTGADIDESAV